MPKYPLVHLLTKLSNHFPYTGVGLRADDGRKQAAKGEEGSCAARSAVCEHAAAQQRQVWWVTGSDALSQVTPKYSVTVSINLTKPPNWLTTCFLGCVSQRRGCSGGLF